MDFSYNDPTLRPMDYARPENISRQNEDLARRLEEMRRNYNVPKEKAETWDEIDRITSGLSEKEFKFLQNNAEFQESSNTVQAILQREYMRIMRPIVENTKDGKDALDKHLTLLRRLVKSVKDESDRRDAMLNDYITNYANITFDEYMKMKKGQPK